MVVMIYGATTEQMQYPPFFHLRDLYIFSSLFKILLSQLHLPSYFHFLWLCFISCYLFLKRPFYFQVSCVEGCRWSFLEGKESRFTGSNPVLSKFFDRCSPLVGSKFHVKCVLRLRWFKTTLPLYQILNLPKN